MKIITEPTVEVVARTEFLGHSKYEIPPDGDHATRLGAFAAKGCYDSYGVEGRPNRENQRAVIEHRHGSVTEHFQLSLFIEGITRGLSLELNRHRHFAISQRSTRYTQEEDAALVLDPYYAQLFERYKDRVLFYVENMYEKAGERDPEYEIIRSHVMHWNFAVEQYKHEVALLEEVNPYELRGFELRKWARGKARNGLPHALETRGTWTGNIRTLRHFLEMRSERFAEAEVRRLAGKVYEAILPHVPVYLEDYDGNVIRGIREFSTPYRKV